MYGNYGTIQICQPSNRDKPDTENDKLGMSVPEWKRKHLDPDAITHCSKVQRMEPNFSDLVDSGHLLSQFQIFDNQTQESSRSVHSLSSSPSTESYHSLTFPPYMEESDDSQRTMTPSQLDFVVSNCASSMHSDETGFEQFSVLGSPPLLFNDPESQHLLESCIQSELGDDEDEQGNEEGQSSMGNFPSFTTVPCTNAVPHTSRHSVSMSFVTSSSSTVLPSPPPSPSLSSPTTVETVAQATDSHPSESNSSCVSGQRVRPQTLPLHSTTDSSRSFGCLNPATDMPLSFTNTLSSNAFLDLEEQLASADIAWMGALDIPNICLEDMDQLLSPTSCLTSPTADTLPMIIPDSSSLRPSPHKRRKCDISPKSDEIRESVPQSTVPVHTPKAQNKQTQPEQRESDERFRHFPTEKVCSNGRKDEAVDTDSTLTCSEAEYYCNWIEQRSKRARRRRRVTRRPVRRSPQPANDSDSEDSDSGTGEISEWNPSAMRRLSSSTTVRRPASYTYRHGSAAYRRAHCKPTPNDDMKPWWPKTKTSFWTGCGISVDVPPQSPEDPNFPDDEDLAAPMECEQLTCCISDTEGTPRSNDSGCSCGLTSSPSIKTSTSLLSSISPSDGINHQNKLKSKSSPHPIADRFVVDAAGHQSIWRARRRRKQLELWQFILCKLETSKTSAFQWVNRSTGVFCITDTVAGAREWGRYRNNSRMDYEKMARAMRFYYKDSILRKSRQQLHFQFAMSYVEWASRFYRSR